MDIFLNALIFVLTLTLTVRFFHKDGTWHISNGTAAFRFFTVLSNELCAAAALLMCLTPSEPWVWTFKYIGTAAVTVTMLTVFLFLGPNLGYKKMLTGPDLYMHLVTPLLALISFCVLERRGLSLPVALLGLLPTALYGVLYAYKILAAPPEKAWKDFYGFNRGGKWGISLACMLLGTLLICLGLMGLQSL